MKRTPYYIALFAVLLSACSPSRNAAFARNQEKWRAANVSHYRFNLTVSCFCPFSRKMPLTIEVQDGSVMSVKYNDGSSVGTDISTFAAYLTIDDLFNYTESAMLEADEIHIKYDAAYGFPSDVSIDYIKNAMDDEMSLQVRNFEPLN